jgi:hypothetical protein
MLSSGIRIRAAVRRDQTAQNSAPKIIPKVTNSPASFPLGSVKHISRKERFPRSEWIHVRLALVEGLDGFNDLLPG